VLRYPHRMGLENPLHIILLLVVILLVFGAKRLPEIGRSLGEGLRGFKDSISGESHHQDSLTSAPAAAPPAPAPATVAPTAAPAPPTAAPVEDTAASRSPSAS
jgi:sec-independent protein translocase protein TatA